MNTLKITAHDKRRDREADLVDDAFCDDPALCVIRVFPDRKLITKAVNEVLLPARSSHMCSAVSVYANDCLLEVRYGSKGQSMGHGLENELARPEPRKRPA